MKKTLLLIAVQLMIFLFAFPQADTSLMNISVLQKGKVIPTKAGYNVLSIDKESFSVEFNIKVYSPKKTYNVQLSALKNQAELSAFKEGADIEDIPFLIPGSGLAYDPKSGYSSLILNPEANHYIIWEEKGEQRAKLVTRNKNDIRLRLTIEKLTFNSKEFTIQESTFITIFLAFFSDQNFNGIVDEGEWEILEINFK